MTRWWRQETPVGEMTVVAGKAGIRRIQLNGSDPLKGDFDCDGAIAAELDEYFAGRRRRFTVPVDLSDVTAAFRPRVLETLHREVA